MTKLPKLILTSKHSLRELNIGKSDFIKEFLSEYKKATLFYVDYLFNNKIIFTVKDKERILDIKKDLLDCPSFISTINIIPEETRLSGRVLKAASTQACGIIKSIIDKRRKLLYILKLKQSRHERCRNILKKLKATTIKYPNIDDIKAELNSNCANFGDNKLKYFDNILILSSLGKSFHKLFIPYKGSKHSKLLEDNNGKRLNSVLLSDKYLYIRYEQDIPKLKKVGDIVGIDQGIKTCLTLSDGQASNKLQGHDLDTITNKIKRKKTGSKAFHKAVEHRDNYIGWAVNKLNFSNIREIRIEKVTNFRHKKRVSKKLNYFGEKVIMERCYKKCQRNGVRIVEEDSAYKSQRCSCCGIVLKSNRKGKRYCCKHCSFQADADFNSSLNQKASLPSLRKYLRHLDNKKGFFWKAEGLFNLDGQELTVPVTKKKILIY
jgi:transposase